MAVANGGYPFTQRDVVTEIYGDSSNRSLTELFSAATGTFDPAYVGSKNSLYNFRNYQHIQPNGGYGRLYNLYTLEDSRNIAPSGWHIPTLAECTLLVNYIGGISVGGGKLKETGINHWLSPNTGATDDYQFAMVASGRRLLDGTFSGIKQYGDIAWHNGSIQTFHDTNAINGPGDDVGYVDHHYGMGVRLIKDDSNDTGIMTDNSGYTYKTVKIGNQVWMASNLRGTKYRNGDTIPTVTDNAAWAALTTGACCSYNNNDAYSYADNYVLPGTTVRIQIESVYDGINDYMYAQAIDESTGSPTTVNTNVTIYFTYSYYDYALQTAIPINTLQTIISGNDKTTNTIIGGPLVNYTPTSVSPTNYNSYTYII